MEGIAVSEEKVVIENETLNSETVTPSTPEMPAEPAAEAAAPEIPAPKIEIVDEDDFFEEVDPSPVPKKTAQSQPEFSAAQAGASAEQTWTSTDRTGASTTQTASSATYEEEPASRRFFRSHREEALSRDQLILSRISNAELMDYLRLEEKRAVRLQEAKEVRSKRIMTAFMTTICLGAIVCIVYLLKDNPAILVNILYIAGLLAAFWFWKKK